MIIIAFSTIPRFIYATSIFLSYLYIIYMLYIFIFEI